MPTATLSRSKEMAQVAKLLTSAATQPSGLVIAGEAGIGKTTIWLKAVERAAAEGFRVLSARAGQAESVLAYAAVADLLAGVDPQIFADLPDVQRLAIERILLRAGGDGPDTGQWVAAAAFMAVVDALSHQSPALIAIDDVQWLDSSSRAVVQFATRRLRGRIGVLVTVRTDADQPSAGWISLSRPDGVALFRVAPMSLGALHRMISDRLGRSLPRPTMARIAEASGGNPFYALELARAVLFDSGNDLVLPPTLAELVRNRIQRFDEDTRAVLLAAASVTEPTVELVGATTGRSVPEVVELLEHAERDGLVTLDGNRLRFAHPLLARGVYTNATAPQRRRMHRALSEVEPQPELKARHLALGSASADSQVLQTLDEAAEVARGRGAPAAAAELTDLARRLGGDTAMRRLRAAGDHFQAGDTARSQELLESSLTELTAGPARAVAQLLLAGIAIYANRLRDAKACLHDAIDHAFGVDSLLIPALVMLSFAEGMSYCWDESLKRAHEAVLLAEESSDGRFLSQALAHQVAMRFMFGEPLDEHSLARALECEDFAFDQAFPARASGVYALVLALSGRLEDAEEQMLKVQRHYLDRGAERDLMAVAGYRAMIAMWHGRLSDAATIADEAVERSEQLGGNDVNVIPLSVRGAVAAHRGRVDDARRDAETVIESATRLELPSMAAWPIATLGFLETSRGDYAAAVKTFEPLMFIYETRPCTDPINGWAMADAIEALIGVGRLDEAEALIDKWESDGRRLDRAWVLAASNRCRAILLASRGDVTAAIDAAERAMCQCDRVPMPFETARTLLVAGQLNRRKRQKQKAADVLTEALSRFEALGAPLWAERARTELARTHVTTTQNLGLTPSEQRVAELAASGMTTRDIAAKLFISPKTVEHNIGRIYRKLGVRSRAELGQRMHRLGSDD
ncbi:helix-turn-helix transcriptional regulator [Mycolicibacterium sp. XJ1819]